MFPPSGNIDMEQKEGTEKQTEDENIEQRKVISKGQRKGGV